MNPTPNMFPSRQSRSWHEKAFWTLARAILTEPAKELGTEAPSHPRLKTLLRELHSGKVDSPRGTNHSPNAPLLSKATLAFFSPSPLVSIGQRGSGLPLAPWALLLCWCSPELGSHSKRVLLRGEAGVGTKQLLGAGPSKHTKLAKELSTEGPSHPRLKTLFREKDSEKIDSPMGTNHSPNAPLVTKATLAFFSPSPLVSIGQRGSGLPLTSWPCCFAGGLLSLNPTPNLFPFVDIQELAGKCLLEAGHSKQTEQAWEVSTEAPSHPRLKMRF